MRYILLIIGCAFGMVACHKNGNSLTAGSDKLEKISSDSAGVWSFGYTGDEITNIVRDSVDGTLENADNTVTIQYTTTPTDAAQYVTLNYINSPDYSWQYSLNASKLPLAMTTIGPGGLQYTMATFVYLPETNLLDSVICNLYSYMNVYKFTYSGQNITQISQQYISSTQNFTIGTFNITYGNTPNVFRKTDSLLYIYDYPITALGAQPMVIAAFFAETFSESTFNGMTVYSANFNSGLPGTFSTTMNYTQNTNGKITSEVFSDNPFEGLAGKVFTYQ